MSGRIEDNITAGTILGGKAAAQTNIKRYGEDFYRRLGALGGSAEKTKPNGFAWMAKNDPERLSEIGSRGGRTSRRGKKS